MGEYVYRYMPLKIFEELLNDKVLTLVRPYEAWEDSYEGIIFQCMQEEKGRQIIRKVCLKYSNDENEIMQMVIGNIAYIFCQSWTRACDDSYMWNEYGHDYTSVMISVKRTRLEEQFWVEDIEYLPYEDIYTLLELSLKKCANEDDFCLHKIYSDKRMSYEKEQEVRVFNYPTSEEEIRDCRYTREWDKGLLRAEIVDISNFINSVLLHPKADDKSDMKLRELCKKNNISYQGKSKVNLGGNENGKED